MLGRTSLLALTLLLVTGILCCGPSQAFASEEALPADADPGASAPAEETKEKTETSTGGKMEALDWAVIGGYFALQASGYDEAVRLLEDNPHLEFGGTIEVREVDEV